MYRLLVSFLVSLPGPSSRSWRTLFLKAHFRHEPDQAASQARQSRLVLAPVAIAAERSFVILGQFILLSAGKTGMDALLAGDLSQRFAGLKLGYY